jgi:hypothetical protein
MGYMVNRKHGSIGKWETFIDGYWQFGMQHCVWILGYSTVFPVGMQPGVWGRSPQQAEDLCCRNGVSEANPRAEGTGRKLVLTQETINL